MAVTIKDVAAFAGVNPSTVSRVIKDSPSISDKTKIKVRKAMETLGYTQNAAAKILASGKSGAIGVIFPPIENKQSRPFFMKILSSINEEARNNDITVAIATGHSIEELEKQVRLMYSEKRVDGFIVLYAGQSDPVRQYLIDENIPFVLVGTPSEMQNEITYVDNDNKLLGKEAVTYLADKGHKHISFVTDTEEGVVFEERYMGFHEELVKRDLVGKLLHFDENNFKIDGESAVIVMDDPLALMVIQSINKQGLSVPEDVSVLSFNNSVFASLIHPHITSFDINVARLGEVAVEKLSELINSDDKSKIYSEKIIVPFYLKERESVK